MISRFPMGAQVRWNGQNGAGWKMLERHGIVLKRSVQIRHAGMAGIASVGKKTQVGEPEMLHESRLLAARIRILPLLRDRMHEQDAHKHQAGQDKGNKKA